VEDGVLRTYGKKIPTTNYICLHHSFSASDFIILLCWMDSVVLCRGSAATALACAICSVQGDTFLGISSELFVLGFVASLATKLSDTFASEIGKAYGKNTFLITTLARVEPGTEGAISAEGTAASVVGGLLLTLFGSSIGLIKGRKAIAISTVAAFLATNVESLLGATLQGKKGLEWITNEVINFFNTLIGATIAIAAGIVFL
jgi:uncharacterized protein (TIGR00297 family)